MKTMIITNVGPIRFELTSPVENIYTAKAYQNDDVIQAEIGTDRKKMLTKYFNMVKTEFMMRSDMPEAELLQEMARMKLEEAA